MGKRILVMLCLFFNVVHMQKHLPNVDCGSYVDYVASDPGYNRYIPFIVKLHRCNGANVAVNAKNKKCVPKKVYIKPIQIYGINYIAGNKILKLENHTACEYLCMLSNSSCSQYENFESKTCACTCKFKQAPKASPCMKPFIWDQTLCKCRCPIQTLKCEKRQEFSSDVCGCVCKQKFNLRCSKRKQVVDDKTCYCVDPPKVITGQSKSGCDGGVKGAVLAVIMILEALAFVVAYFFFYIYCYKRRYLLKKAKNESAITSPNGFTVHEEFNTNPVCTEEVKEVHASPPYENKLQNGVEKVDSGPYNTNYYSTDEKSPFTPKQDSEWYVYSDIMEVEAPQYRNNTQYLHNVHGLVLPDNLSEFSEDGYASVTQV